MHRGTLYVLLVLLYLMTVRRFKWLVQDEAYPRKFGVMLSRWCPVTAISSLFSRLRVQRMTWN